MTTTDPNSLLGRAMARPQPVRQPRRKPAPRIMQLPAPVSCGHEGGRRTIGFGDDGGRVDRCTRCVMVSDRTIRSSNFIADPRGAYAQQQIARGTQVGLEPFERKARTPYDAVVYGEDE